MREWLNFWYIPNITEDNNGLMFGSTRIQLMIEDLSGKNLFSCPPDKSLLWRARRRRQGEGWVEDEERWCGRTWARGHRTIIRVLASKFFLHCRLMTVSSCATSLTVPFSPRARGRRIRRILVQKVKKKMIEDENSLSFDRQLISFIIFLILFLLPVNPFLLFRRHNILSFF